MPKKSDATRRRIVDAAVATIADGNFHNASTRDIARRAGVQQGLLSYYFDSKEALWRLAVDKIFAVHSEFLAETLTQTNDLSPEEKLQKIVFQLVWFSAKHPEFMGFLRQYSLSDRERTGWVVEKHLQKIYDATQKELSGLFTQEDFHHIFYILGGAAGSIFSARRECQVLTGHDVLEHAEIERHAEIVSQLLLPKKLS